MMGLLNKLQPKDFSRRKNAESVLVSAITCDLENLLNTRCYKNPDLKNYPLASRSIVGYGLPDFSEFNLHSATDKKRFAEILAELIKNYEPRLKETVVHIVKSPTEKNRSWHFQIEALIKIQEKHAAVIFNSVLHSVNGQFKVYGEIDEEIVAVL